MIEENDTVRYHVVVNHEEQYSIWGDGRPVPNGWALVGVSGSKKECLEHVEKIWTDMRPLSLRRKMAEAAAAPKPAPDLPIDRGVPLVERLSVGDHPIEYWPSPTERPDALREGIEAKLLHIRFTETRGGTTLGITLDEAASDLSGAYDEGGRLHIVGRLTLDFTPCRCIADLDPKTLNGRGKLELIAVTNGAS